MNPVSRRAFFRTATAFTAGAIAPVSWPIAPAPLSEVATACVEHARRVSRDNKLSVLMPQGCEPNLRPVIRAFEQATGIAISQEIAPVDDINTYLMLSAADKIPKWDVALPATFGIPDLADAGIIQPLDEFVERYEPADLADEQLYQTGSSYLNRFYGYQTDGDVYLLFCNTHLAKSMGLEIPGYSADGGTIQPVASWADLDQLMQKAHAPERGVFGGTLFRSEGYLAWEFWLRLHAKGVMPLSPDGEPQLNHPAAVDALAELIDASQYQAPGAATDTLFDNWASFAKGDKVLNIGWGGSQKYFRRHHLRSHAALRENTAVDNIVAFLAPGQTLGRPGLPYFNWGWNYTVLNRSPRAELAYLFSLYAASPQISAQAVRAEDGYFDPYQRAHYSDPDIRRAYSDAFLDVHQDGMSRCIPDLYLKSGGRYRQTLSRMLQLCYAGHLSPEKALQYATDQWLALHEEVGVSRQQAVWSSLRNAYPGQGR